MYLFNSKLQLRKYDTVNEIIDDYYIERLNLYDRRKKFIINKLNNELIKLSNKARFINENLEGTIDLRHKTREQINKLLAHRPIHQNREAHFNFLKKTENTLILIKSKYPFLDFETELNRIRNKIHTFETND